MIKKSIKQKVKQYAEWTEEVVAEAMSQGFYSAGHFSHIMRNLTVSLECLIEESELGNREADEDIIVYLDALQKYKASIESNPDFKKGELLNSESGQFPDIRSSGSKREYGLSGVVNYALESAKILEGCSK